MLFAIQLTETFLTKSDAENALAHMQTQAGFIGGRVLPPKDGAQLGDRLQAFFIDEGAMGTEWLPDGCRRVSIPDSLLGALGIEPAARR